MIALYLFYENWFKVSCSVMEYDTKRAHYAKVFWNGIDQGLNWQLISSLYLYSSIQTVLALGLAILSGSKTHLEVVYTPNGDLDSA